MTPSATKTSRATGAAPDGSHPRDAKLHRQPGSRASGERQQRAPQAHETNAEATASHRSDDAGWWAVTGSNRRPSRCKRDALPTELTAPVLVYNVLNVSLLRFALRCRTVRTFDPLELLHRTAPPVINPCGLFAVLFGPKSFDPQTQPPLHSAHRNCGGFTRR